MIWQTRVRVMPSRRAMAAWLSTSPPSSWRRHSWARRRNLAALEPGVFEAAWGCLAVRMARACAGMAQTTWSAGKRCVRLLRLLVPKAQLRLGLTSPVYTRGLAQH